MGATGTRAEPVPPTAPPGPVADRPRPRRRPQRTRWRGAGTAWLFLAPALLIFTVFKFVPMGRAFDMSFHEVRPYLGDLWVGMDNYTRVLTDEAFSSAIVRTVVLAVGQTGGSLVLGFGLALLLEGTAKHLWFVRTAVFLPTIVAMAVVAEVWRILYYPGPDGTVNSVLGWVGLGPSQFLNDEDTSLWSVMSVGVWRGAPYDMMIFLAGLSGVDRTLYEASSVDGASIPRRIWHVTLPALRPVFAILFTLAAIRGLRVFTEIFLLTNGGPNGSTEVLMTLIYKVGLERHDLGVASAGSVLLLLATVVLTLAVRFARRGRDSKAAS
ncbi:carbohydrate ABC transporter permease [Phytomonospora endophytica]|uniref:Multiple sugar transport system permease protein n=1 Tax=Phytomonospora endophytica TaxID=714109 RepID=A0A841FQC4_9ACTN|nr:sugar ABC transporter permease [Phytomonospora endophytica]MBB6034160.1 multiple sugar transport system permease protein [Phytomonospora endophytica]GIG66552.1 sugar ABC transporter permease [Phytomonospora endophytica]